MSAEKRSVSAPATLFAAADARKEQLGYPTFSDYIQALIRADTISGGDHLRESTSPAGVSAYSGAGKIAQLSSGPLTAKQKDNDRIALQKLKAVVKLPRKATKPPQ